MSHYLSPRREASHFKEVDDLLTRASEVAFAYGSKDNLDVLRDFFDFVDTCLEVLFGYDKAIVS
jgi:hypothetical protein